MRECRILTCPNCHHRFHPDNGVEYNGVLTCIFCKDEWKKLEDEREIKRTIELETQTNHLIGWM